MHPWFGCDYVMKIASSNVWFAEKMDKLFVFAIWFLIRIGNIPNNWYMCQDFAMVLVNNQAEIKGLEKWIVSVTSVERPCIMCNI